MLLRAAGICVLKPWTLTLVPEQNLIPFEMRAVFRMNGLLLLAEKKKKTVLVSSGENSLHWFYLPTKRT